MINLNNHILICLISSLTMACANGQNTNNKVEKSEPKFTNELIHEDSPYLLQHAHNPVNWLPWGDAAFEKAKTEDKLVIVSIGYSSCHWCHVMEHESFENEQVAELMNEHFVCIKVDREERPDVDQVYMNAVQLMTGQGGWPLNCITLSDGRPIYGGTYFPKAKWVDVLSQLHGSYVDDKDKVLEYAEKLTTGVQNSELITVKEESKPFKSDKLHEMVQQWSVSFDNFRGGPNRAPKFPIPNNYDFLMRYAHQFNDTVIMQHVDLTLEKMAFGGIYDQVGGGFSRYSTDAEWKVPHFEKMLYDNAQLVSLYAHAYQRTKNPLYQQIVAQTLTWNDREMTTKDGSFYSALDADSEGEEGKFYVWTKEELKACLGDDYEFAKKYYNVDIKGYWEGNYILLRNQNDAAIADEFEINLNDVRKKVDQINAKLLQARTLRVRPGLDDKSLTSWNCMMTVGYLDAYQAFGDENYLATALKNVNWFEKNQLDKDGKLRHTYKNGRSKIDGFLEDYAFAIQMYLKLYQVTFDEKHIKKAQLLTEYVLLHFEDDKSGMFFFTSNKTSDLVARKMELSDNVIPASNSVMARNLFDLGTLLDDKSLIKKSQQMLSNVYAKMHEYGPGYSNWGSLLLSISEPYYQIAITGKKWKSELTKMEKAYLPSALLMGGNSGELPLLEGKFVDETTIYVCVNKACLQPVSTAVEALKQIK